MTAPENRGSGGVDPADDTGPTAVPAVSRGQRGTNVGTRGLREWTS